MLATIGILLWEGVTFGAWLVKITSSSGSGEAVGKVVRRALEEGTSGGGGEGIIRPLVSPLPSSSSLSSRLTETQIYRSQGLRYLYLKRAT